MSAARKSLDATAVAVMVLLCLIWGFNQVAAKLAAHGVSLVMQAGIRSAVATLLLVAWARVRDIPLLEGDGTLGPGLLAGALFGAEFLFIFLGLAHTTASRLVVFVYLAPCFTALGLAWLVPGERLTAVQWVGVVLGFAGVALAFSEGFFSGAGAGLLGDVYGVLAGALWAATTVLIRATRLGSASASKTLLYQLAVSAVGLLAASRLLGEPGVVALDAVTVASLVYQGAIVAFASYLAWFWLLTKYLAARLSVFSFLTPLFGVLAGVLVLGEPLTPIFVCGAVLVGAGIVLVNRRRT